MKIVAHPLVVAAALGFLGPGALFDVEDPEFETTECARSAAAEPVVSPEEFARVEAEWLEARVLLSAEER